MKRLQWFVMAILLTGLSARADDRPITLKVDATDAPRGILRARLNIPAHPGPLTLVYPKWIPGEHGPTGPINDLTGLEFSADGKHLAWQRDPVDMFAFRLEVPPGTDAVDVSLDFLLPQSPGSFSSGGSSSAKLLDLNWNQILLYPDGEKAREVLFKPSVKLPKGWQFGTALQGGPDFSPVSLETLVDSPVIAGEFFRSIDLSPGTTPAHELDIVADSAAALDVKPEVIGHYRHLITETGVFFQARHYRGYHFLLTLSDHVAHFGLEHHESSDNREPENYLTDEAQLKRGAYLLCHEMTHSWNGKYRRPAGLATDNYQQPMKGELLWVYEGLTDYLGALFAERCGLWTNETFREYLALDAASLDHESGRQWRSLADTTVAAQLLYEAPHEGESYRRGTDFYQESDFIWIEVDTVIRAQTGGKKTLEDFARKFYGGESGPPKVIPYDKEDIFAALNEIAPYDWAKFFHDRVYMTTKNVPMGGLEAAGWKLAYTNEVPALQKSRESARKYTDMRYSLGFMVHEDGVFPDVLKGSPADKAGIGLGMKLIAVNGRRWTPEILRQAVKDAVTNKEPIELLVENADYFKTCKIKYHHGENYPVLQRIPSKADLLGEILKPLTPEPKP